MALAVGIPDRLAVDGKDGAVGLVPAPAAEVSGHGRKVMVYGSERKGAKQFQEDAHFFWSSATGKVVVSGVFDGHGGYNGLIASNVARDFSRSFLQHESKNCENWSVQEWKDNLVTLFDRIHTAIKDSFIEKSPSNGPHPAAGQRYVDNNGIVRTGTGDPVHGGTTGTVSVLVKMGDGSCSVISANAGDSAALIIPHHGKFDFITVDHGPENPDEFARLQQLPAKQFPIKLLFVYDKTNVARKYDCPRVFLDDGNKDAQFVQNPWGLGLHPTNVRFEPAVYAVTPRTVSKDTTCIAMTRALGDFYAHQFGLTHVPSVVVKNVPADTQFTVLVASDGIWDCWKYEEFTDYINQLLKIHEGRIDAVVEAALSESIQRAITNFGARHYDDASIVCMFCPI